MPVPSSKLRLALADGWLRQALLFLAAYLLYGASRWVVTGDEATALEHARWIVELEESLGVAVEASLQRALEHTALLWLLNHVYVAAQLVVVPAALFWLYRRDQLAYRRLRDTVLATWLLALAGSARRRWTRALALAWAPTIFLAVVATGNHFLIDIVAGIAITLVGFGAARLAAGRRETAHTRPARRLAAPPALATGGDRGG